MAVVSVHTTTLTFLHQLFELSCLTCIFANWLKNNQCKEVFNTLWYPALYVTCKNVTVSQTRNGAILTLGVTLGVRSAAVTCRIGVQMRTYHPPLVLEVTPET